MTVSGDGARAAGDTPLLEVRDLVVHHGQLRALDAVSLRVFPGEVYAIIGANGAGKSTLLRTIAGLHSPTTGSVLFDGKDVTRVRPERRATRGIVMVPEGRRLFESLSVEENLKVGATYARQGPWTIERVYEMFGWMRERRNQLAAQLSGGEQQTVAIGRALVANPRVLMLDELSLGLAPVVVQRIYGMLPQILATGLTVLLVEQDVSQALRVASHIHCLLEGRTTLVGTPASISADQVEAAYFGLSVVIENGLLQFFTANSRAIGTGLSLVSGSFSIGSIQIGYLLVAVYAVAVIVLLGLQYFLSSSRYGRLIRAVADDKEAAQLAGADYRHVFGVAAAIAFGTVALGGIAYGMYSQLQPTTGTDTILLFAFAAVVIGGLGSLWGTLLGGVVLGIAQQIGAQISISDETLAGFIVFLAVLVLRPQGLISRGAQS